MGCGKMSHGRPSPPAAVRGWAPIVPPWLPWRIASVTGIVSYVSSSGRRSVVRVAISAALLAANGSGVLHLAVADHDRCAEHGEMIERQGVPPGVPRVSGDPRSGLLDMVDSFTRESRADAHDHCLVLLQARTCIGPEAARGEAVALDPALPAPRHEMPAEPRGPPLYRVAPKNSPPA